MFNQSWNFTPNPFAQNPQQIKNEDKSQEKPNDAFANSRQDGQLLIQKKSEENKEKSPQIFLTKPSPFHSFFSSNSGSSKN